MASKTKSLSRANTGPTGDQALTFLKKLTGPTGDQALTFLKKLRELEKQFELRPEQILAGMQNLIGEKKQSQIISQPTIISKRPNFIKDWERFYYQIFGLKLDFSGVPIPDHPDDYTWPICMPQVSILGDEMALSRGKWQYNVSLCYADNMDTAINHDLKWSRDSWDKPYIVFVRPNIEADKDMKNILAKTIFEQSINTITFRERILLQRFLLWKKNLILDMKTTTLCFGSRYLDGRVPSVYWDMHDSRVGVVAPSYDEKDSWRVRRAVSI